MEKNNFKLYDQNKYFISRNNSFRRKYKYTLEMKKKISLFYGNLTTKYIKQQISVALKTQSFLSNNRINLNSYFIKLFEKRLDSVLYRSHFTLSLRNARQLISHRHVFVNNQIVTNSSYILKTGDLIEINLKIYSLIDDYISRSNLWSFPPKYLQVNYKTLQIVFLDEEKSWNNSMSFPFWVDVRSIVKFYR
jgi:small subunit ribosomal protein S4